MEAILVGLTGLTGGFRLLSSSIDLSNPRWNDCAYGELKSSLSKNWVRKSRIWDWVLREVQTRAMLFLKSMSERVGSDKERLWIQMKSS